MISFSRRSSLKTLLNFLQYCLCFMFRFFGRETCRILAPQLGMKPIPPALEGKVLATGLPGKSKSWDFNLGYPAVGNGGGLFEKWECWDTT